MKLIRFCLFSFFLLALGLTSRGGTFIVTNNANAGVGSLRHAITQANENGTSVTDYIHFNIADLSENARTIIMQSALPALSSNIVVDGTTQPGPAFSISNAKVILLLDHYIEYQFTFLLIESATNVKVFGMGFKISPGDYIGEGFGIRIRKSSDVTVGEPGRGNLFSGLPISVGNSFWNYFDDSVHTVKIQSNICGLILYNAPNSYRGGGSVNFIRCRNITIGGPAPEEGNSFAAAWILLTEASYPNPDFFVRIENNRFNYNGINYASERGYIELSGNYSDTETSSVKTLIKNNLLAYSNWDYGIGLNLIRHKVVIQGNKLGTDLSGLNCLSTNGISVSSCDNVIIGGHSPEEENIITGDISVNSHGVHIIKNKIDGKILSNAIAPDDPFIKISSYENGLITGIANPASKIQVYTDLCQQTGNCVSKKYLATTFSDAAGNWRFPYTAAMPALIATATMPDSSTSAFTEPKVAAFVNEEVIAHASCGRSNGSITGIRVIEGTHIRWFDNTSNQLIGRDTNISNLAAGNYRLEVSNGENNCPWTAYFSIDDFLLPPDLDPVTVTAASCGQNNGDISTADFDYGSKWLNANNDSIGTGNAITRLFAGTYYLKLWVRHDTSCNKLYGPFTLINQRGPDLNTSLAIIAPASCGNANGSITNIIATNVTGSAYIEWRDSLNSIVGNALNLVSQPAGNYTLKFKDQGTCDTIVVSYIIPIAGNISIDTSGKLITAAGCQISNGSIRQIQVSGADQLQWWKIPGNIAAGNSIDVSGLSPGNYQLTASNVLGCRLVSPVITVPPDDFSAISPIQSLITDAVCGENNGSLVLQGFTNEAAIQSYHWINQSNGNVVGTGVSLTALGAGVYDFMVTDTNGCEKSIFHSSVVVYPKPDFSTSDLLLSNDNCSLLQGSITGIRLDGLQGPTVYTWTNAANEIVGNTADLLQVPAGDYRLRVKDKELCVVESAVFSLINEDRRGVLPNYAEVTVQKNTAADLRVKNFSAGIYILYDDAAGTRILAQNASGVFTTDLIQADRYFYVRHITGSCSTAIADIKITTVDRSGFAIPSAFTPNNDGLNDKLLVNVVGYIELEYFRIYNRSGQEVFFTKTPNDGWDGRIQGKLQTAGVYVWMARGRDVSGKIMTGRGSFVLVK